MSLLERAREVAAAPGATAARVRLRVAPRSAVARHAARARAAGIDELVLIVSFDCDTDEDIEAALDVHEQMLALDVTPAYAVPGDLLRRGAEVYRKIAATGSEFLNHGDREHTYFDHDRGRHASCYFYDRLDPAAVRRDVEDGDRTVRDVLGTAPKGFRTPHFGTYQHPSQLGYLHRILGRLGYAYSSSTVPLYGLRYGPAFRRFGLVELPVTGSSTRPAQILDTWTFFAAPGRNLSADDFRAEAAALADNYRVAGAGVINIYGDPSHIRGRDEFFDGIDALRKVAKPMAPAALVERLR